MLINILLTLLLINPTQNVYYTDKLDFDNNKIEVSAPERINEQNIGVKVNAKRFAVLDLESGRVLLQKDSNLKQPIASITKIMTTLVILDQEIDWQKEVEMLKVDETVGAYPHIYRGEKVKFIDLWKSALIASDNNSIQAMIRALDLSESEFVTFMNTKAKDLQMYNTNFADPTGLDENNLSTALDVSKLIHFAMQKNEIRESVLQNKYKFRILNNKKLRKISNTDILIDSFLNSSRYGYELIGGKTGYLPEAGYCLAVEIKNNQHPIVIVVLGSDTVENRFYDVKVIADWIFENYNWKK